MNKKTKDSIRYFFLTVMAFALFGFGIYLLSIEGIIYKIVGVFFIIIGYTIGKILYKDNWDFPGGNDWS